jgi:hypothetical protein
MLEIPWGNNRDTDKQNSAAISRPVYPRFTLGIYATTRAENSGGWIGKNKNSDGEHKRSQNGCSCMGSFVRYHVVTVTSKMGIKETGCESMDLTHMAQDGVQLGVVNTRTSLGVPYRLRYHQFFLITALRSELLVGGQEQNSTWIRETRRNRRTPKLKEGGKKAKSRHIYFD